MSNKTPIIQICFTLKTGLTPEQIRSKMQDLKTLLDTTYGEHSYECHSCHLSRRLCIDKGFTTEVPDIFAEVFGRDYICELQDETSFDEAMKKINAYRQGLALKADRLVILSEDAVSNVKLELQLFTQNKVLVI